MPLISAPSAPSATPPSLLNVAPQQSELAADPRAKEAHHAGGVEPVAEVHVTADLGPVGEERVAALVGERRARAVELAADPRAGEAALRRSPRWSRVGGRRSRIPSARSPGSEQSSIQRAGSCAPLRSGTASNVVASNLSGWGMVQNERSRGSSICAPLMRMPRGRPPSLPARRKGGGSRRAIRRAPRRRGRRGRRVSPRAPRKGLAALRL